MGSDICRYKPHYRSESISSTKRLWEFIYPRSSLDEFLEELRVKGLGLLDDQLKTIYRERYGDDE